jgi:hypothetical protein
VAGAVLTDRLTRRHGVKRAGSVALALPLFDATYDTEWEVIGPTELDAHEVRVVIRLTPKSGAERTTSE